MNDKSIEREDSEPIILRPRIIFRQSCKYPNARKKNPFKVDKPIKKNRTYIFNKNKNLDDITNEEIRGDFEELKRNSDESKMFEDFYKSLTKNSSNERSFDYEDSLPEERKSRFNGNFLDFLAKPPKDLTKDNFKNDEEFLFNLNELKEFPNELFNGKDYDDTNDNILNVKLLDGSNREQV